MVKAVSLNSGTTWARFLPAFSAPPFVSSTPRIFIPSLYIRPLHSSLQLHATAPLHQFPPLFEKDGWKGLRPVCPMLHLKPVLSCRRQILLHACSLPCLCQVLPRRESLSWALLQGLTCGPFWGLHSNFPDLLRRVPVQQSTAWMV